MTGQSLKKFISLWMAGISVFVLTSCGHAVESPYSAYQTPADYGLTANQEESSGLSFFSSGLCVTEDTNLNTDTVDSQVAAAAGLFNTVTGSVPYKQNIFGRVYPASTTKVLTALVALKYGNPDDIITVSENAVNLTEDSSVANLHAGDRLTLRQLLYGLLLASGNDAAIAIAEGVSGDTDSFVTLMNQEAKEMGAAHSNFVNANGLHDDNHYTCAYDMYIIFHNALKYDVFKNIIKADKMDAKVTHSDGTTETVTYESTNLYKTKQVSSPDGIRVIGGKTGTTDNAGYCLVLLSENSQGQQIITTVYKAESKWELYQMTNRLLTSFAST